MRRMRSLIAVVVGLSLSAAATVEAAGICFQAGNYNLAVVKKYSRPPRGTCKNFAGWEAFSGGSQAVFGTACLNSAGTELRVGYTVAAYGEPDSVWMTLPYPSLTGGGATTKFGSSSGWIVSAALAGSCFQLFLPMP
jgi:hypothetical protein